LGCGVHGVRLASFPDHGQGGDAPTLPTGLKSEIWGTSSLEMQGCIPRSATHVEPFPTDKWLVGLLRGNVNLRGRVSGRDGIG